MTTAQILIIAVIVIYLLGMLAIGYLFNKKGGTKGSEEFYLGGRRMGPLVTAMSAEASDMSSYLLMGLPGLAYLCGLPEVTWTSIGLAVGTYLNWLIVARRIRRYSENIGAITIPNYFSKRFHDDRFILSCIAALVILVFFIPYTASGFKAVGTLFSSLFGFDYHWSMIVGAVIIVTYTVLGGFMAVSTTDLIQSIFMTLSLIIIVFYGIGHAGGMEAVIANAQALPGYLSLTEGFNLASESTQSFGFLPIVSTLAWGLGYFGMPHILLRFMAIRDEKELKTSRRIASIWVVVAMGIAEFIGIIGYSLSKNGSIPMLLDSSSSETVIIEMSNLMSQSGIFFAIVAGIIMAGILACTMSTADSQLLAAASSVSEDLLQDFFKIKMSQKTQMLVARLTVIAIAIVGVVLAWNPNSSVFRIVSFAWAGFGGAFGPLVLFSLFWKRVNKSGALAGMISGGAVVFIWKYLVRPIGGAWDIYELLPAFIVSSIFIVAVSLLTKEPDESILKEFEAAKVK